MNKIDLLIVGAGPVGLMLALESSRYGTDFRIIDKAPEASDKSKALAIWSGTQEALAATGSIDVFLEKGIKVHGICMRDKGRVLARNDAAEGVESLYPRPIIVPQCETERLLATKIAATGRKIERPTELVSLAQKEDGVECVLRRADGSEETVLARYVAGCDGARSVARETLKTEFPGITESVHFLLIDCLIDGGDLKEDEITMSWSEEGGIAFFPVVKGVWRIFAQRENQEDLSDPTLEEFQAFVDRFFPGKNMKLRDPQWLSIFRINERVAAQFWQGRIFLLGDAAHIHSPAGGQGMNTGMQDAANLAWKLSLLLKGRGNEEIIKKSYQEERHPVAEAVVKGATEKLHFGMAKGMAIRVVKDVAISLLLHVPAFRQHVTRDLSELCIHYQGPLIDASAPWGNAKSGFAPGTRPRDAVLRDENGESVSLWRRFLRPRHTLLLFSGKSVSGIDGATRKLIALCCADAKSEIDPVLIWQGSTVPSVDCCECLLDEEGAAHRQYGMEQGGWYLIRPDQYVATRCQASAAGPLESYIAKVLKS